MGSGITLWLREGSADCEQAKRFLRQNQFAADDVRDLATDGPRGADWDRLRSGLGGELWPLVNHRHPGYGGWLPRGAEDCSDEDLRALMEAHPDLMKAPILLTPKGALAGFRERKWAEFLGVGKVLRGG
jgi:arsenate reductase-like glutaredoxin family protein